MTDRQGSKVNRHFKISENPFQPLINYKAHLNPQSHHLSLFTFYLFPSTSKAAVNLKLQTSNFKPRTSNQLRNRKSHIPPHKIIPLLAIHRHHDILLAANGIGRRN